MNSAGFLVADPVVTLAEIAREGMPVDADGLCPFCLTGGFGPSMARPGERVLCRARFCQTCRVVLRWGDVPELDARQRPRVLNALGGTMHKENLGTATLYGRTGLSRSQVEETVTGDCPCCGHPLPRKIKGVVRCPCGTKVNVTGRTAAELERDRLKATEEASR